MLQSMWESIHSLYLFCNLMIADITLNCKSKCINSHTSFASLFHFSIFYFLPFVEDAQCQQHGAVEQHAYGKYKLKITPLRIGCGAKAQHAQMPQPVGNGNRNCPLYAAADMLPPRRMNHMHPRIKNSAILNNSQYPSESPGNATQLPFSLLRFP